MDEGTTPSFINFNTTHFLHMNTETISFTSEEFELLQNILNVVEEDLAEQSGCSQELVDSLCSKIYGFID